MFLATMLAVPQNFLRLLQAAPQNFRVSAFKRARKR